MNDDLVRQALEMILSRRNGCKVKVEVKRVSKGEGYVQVQ